MNGPKFNNLNEVVDVACFFKKGACRRYLRSRGLVGIECEERRSDSSERQTAKRVSGQEGPVLVVSLRISSAPSCFSSALTPDQGCLTIFPFFGIGGVRGVGGVRKARATRTLLARRGKGQRREMSADDLFAGADRPRVFSSGPACRGGRWVLVCAHVTDRL